MPCIRQHTLSFFGQVREGILCRDPEVVLAGPRDTGKTIGILWKLDMIARNFPGVSIVIARRVQRDLWSTVIKSYQENILRGDPSVRVYGGETPSRFIYPRGAVIWTAGMDKGSKVLSAEHDIIYVNQLEETAVMEWEDIIGATTGRAGHYPHPQAIGDCNPGPPSHWIRQRARAGLLHMFSTTHRDNPELYNPVTGQITAEGKRRIGRLDRYTGARKKRYRYGLWAAPEGSVYGNIFEGLLEDDKYGRHLVHSFEIPRHWPRAVGIDPAGAKRAAIWLAYEPDPPRLHVYREMVLPHGSTVQRFGEQLLSVSQGEPVFVWVCGAPSERDWRVEFEAAGVPVQQPPVADFWIGVDRVIELLDTTTLVVHDTCPQLLSEIEEYHRKQDNRTGEFLDVIEDKSKYHLMDCLRYVVVYLTHRETTQEQVGYSPIQIGGY
jgi:hypothetical protein